MTWTRAHDAWLARECEGLDVWVNAGDGAICEYQDDSIPHYNTDPAACIRAAEAWKDRGEDRKITIELRTRGIRVGIGDATAGWHWWTHEWEYPTVAESVAQALIRATGGPA